MSSCDTTPVDTWRKSSRSGGTEKHADCIEVAALEADAVGVRDSKNPRAAVLTFPAAGFAAFMDAVRSGQFDGSDC